MESKSYTVSEVTSRIKHLLTLDEELSDLTVEGEISNFHHHSSGHMYFTLKDSDSRLNSVMFQGDNKELEFDPEDGQQVRAEGYIDVYEPRGEYQLYVKKMEEIGAGELYRKYLQLKKRLEEEGLFEKDRKKDLPFLPAKIGLITSPTGAAIRDILSVLRRRFGSVSVLLVPAHVQGERAEGELIRGLEYLNDRDDIDLIIISRGGGSLEDLWSFNSEKLARTIADSRIPVISGVGHETDFTIADFVADVRAPTPSAAAELAVDDYVRLTDRLKELGDRLMSSYVNTVTSAGRSFDYLLQRHIWRDPGRLFATADQRLDTLTDKFSNQLSHYFQQKHQKLGSISGQLDSLSPLKILARGYSITRSEDGDIITSADEVQPGDIIESRLNKGRLKGEVKSIRKEDDSIE